MAPRESESQILGAPRTTTAPWTFGALPGQLDGIEGILREFPASLLFQEDLTFAGDRFLNDLTELV